MTVSDDPYGEWTSFLRNRDSVKSIGGVGGVALAGPDVMVYVDKVTPDILRELPEDVDGIPVKVKQIGKLSTLPLYQSLSTGAFAHTQFYRPVPGGVSIGHELGTTGTHGGIVWDNELQKLLGISNNHVAGLQWGLQTEGQIGDIVNQPGYYDYPYIEANLGEVLKIYPVPAPGKSTGIIDTVLYNAYSEEWNPNILGVGPASYSVPMEPGMKIIKSGRTTGLTWGKVEAIGGLFDVYNEYDDPDTPEEEKNYVRFEDCAITLNSIAAAGDSGSLAVDSWARVAGQVNAGNEYATILSESQNIEELMNVTFGVTPDADTLEIPNVEPHYVETPNTLFNAMLWTGVTIGAIKVLMSMGKKV